MIIKGNKEWENNKQCKDTEEVKGDSLISNKY